jgi:hypothetical protein
MVGRGEGEVGLGFGLLQGGVKACDSTLWLGKDGGGVDLDGGDRMKLGETVSVAGFLSMFVTLAERLL